MAGSKKETNAQLWTCDRAGETSFMPFDLKEEAAPRRLLLHACCGPCSTACIERLIETFRVTVYFYNPNITDEAEYRLRRDNQLKFLHAYNQTLPQEKQVDFIEGPYEPDAFLTLCKGYEEEPEGGARCTLCFQMRLAQTALAAAEGGFSCFGTTLTVSPHKSYPLVSAIGKQLAKDHQVEFLDADFKKKAGFQRSIELSKAYGLYRQNYCGCVFSKRDL